MAPIPLGTSFLSIDPGEWAAHAVWTHDHKLSHCAKGPAEKLIGLSYCVCELPRIYPSGRSKARPNNIVTLSVRAGRITAAWPEDKILWVPPHEWKAQVPDEILYDRIRAALSPEERLILEYCLRPYAEGKRHNILDAVGIGLYACRRKRTGMV